MLRPYGGTLPRRGGRSMLRPYEDISETDTRTP